MEERFKIIIIEHEDNVRQGLVAVFDQHHFDIETLDNGPEAYDKLRSADFDLLLLDARPGINEAFALCAELRSSKPERVIFMLTADSDNQQIIAHMSPAADDYTSVPFAYTDLVQRAKALLRRSKLQGKTPCAEPFKIADSIEVDPANLSGLCARGKLAFTSREMRVLECLYKNRGKAVDGHELLNQVWGYPRYLNTETRAVDIHIATLVNKIEADAENPQWLKPVGEQAYQLVV